MDVPVRRINAAELKTSRPLSPEESACLDDTFRFSSVNESVVREAMRKLKGCIKLPTGDTELTIAHILSICDTEIRKD